MLKAGECSNAGRSLLLGLPYFSESHHCRWCVKSYDYTFELRMNSVKACIDESCLSPIA